MHIGALVQCTMYNRAGQVNIGHLGQSIGIKSRDGKVALQLGKTITPAELWMAKQTLHTAKISLLMAGIEGRVKHRGLLMRRGSPTEQLVPGKGLYWNRIQWEPSCLNT